MIAILADSHDNLANLKEFLAQAKKNKVDVIIHCGDVTTPEFLEQLIKNFNGQIKLVLGNAEIRPEEFKKNTKNYLNLEIFEEVGLYESIAKINDEGREFAKKFKIAFTHKPEKAKQLAINGEYNFVFYGHTHKPWFAIEKKSVVVANPGTLGGVFSEPTYALLDPDSGKLELKKLFV
ncbi:MAG: metallophosphoesterase family protein [Candidatus Paceibacterota bacterium]|jgi:hypothetical protein